MHIKQPEHIDAFVKEASENIPVAYNEMHWQQMDALLNANTPIVAKPSFIKTNVKWLYATGLVLLGVSLGVIITLLIKDEKTERPIEKKTISALPDTLNHKDRMAITTSDPNKPVDAVKNNTPVTKQAKRTQQVDTLSKGAVKKDSSEFIFW